jgi:nucleoid-associated protein YgaU
LDALAQKAYGDPSRWRWLAAFNRIEDPLRIPAGQVVQIPSLEQRSQT